MRTAATGDRRVTADGDGGRDPAAPEDLPILPLVYPDSFAIYDKAAFDAWYYTEGGVGSTVPAIDNKHVFLTGRQTGLDIRPVAEGE